MEQSLLLKPIYFRLWTNSGKLYFTLISGFEGFLHNYSCESFASKIKSEIQKSQRELVAPKVKIVCLKNDFVCLLCAYVHV